MTWPKYNGQTDNRNIYGLYLAIAVFAIICIITDFFSGQAILYFNFV